MNKIICIPCFQNLIYTAYPNKKIEPPTIKTDSVKQEQIRDPEPLEDLVDYMNSNPFRVLLSGILKKNKKGE